MENCHRYEGCSAPICPLDTDARIRVRLQGEDICPFCRNFKKYGRRQKMPVGLKNLVPQENLILLSERNR